MSMRYRVNRRCSELSHNAVDEIVSVRLLTIASSVLQKVPHDLIRPPGTLVPEGLLFYL